VERGRRGEDGPVGGAKSTDWGPILVEGREGVMKGLEGRVGRPGRENDVVGGGGAVVEDAPIKLSSSVEGMTGRAAAAPKESARLKEVEEARRGLLKEREPDKKGLLGLLFAIICY